MGTRGGGEEEIEAGRGLGLNSERRRCSCSGVREEARATRAFLSMERD